MNATLDPTLAPAFFSEQYPEEVWRTGTNLKPERCVRGHGWNGWVSFYDSEAAAIVGRARRLADPYYHSIGEVEPRNLWDAFEFARSKGADGVRIRDITGAVIPGKEYRL